MTPFRWKNCRADVAACKHGITVQSFFDDVIVPAVDGLEEKIAALSHSEDPSDVFARSDMEDILRETKMAFSLSLQSLWERQLRAYLRGCAQELRPGEGMVERVTKGDWAKLCALFLELRGIALEGFPSFTRLDILQLLGNACRHGDGPSAVELWKRCPDLWPTYSSLFFEHQPNDQGPPPAGTMDVSIVRLHEFVAAIVAFWDDAEYIYNESILRKHPSLVSKLEKERAERSWLPRALSADEG